MLNLPDLEEMEDEVEAYCREKGWYDQEVSLRTAMALLHEEVAEAGHAWRYHGLADATEVPSEADPGGVACDVIVKPEGVGSEFADILIRMLDDSRRFGLLLTEYLEPDQEAFGIHDDFMDNICALHSLVSDVIRSWEVSYENPQAAFAAVLSFLLQLAREYGIDLAAEYSRKMKYNWSRPYRHGALRV